MTMGEEASRSAGEAAARQLWQWEQQHRWTEAAEAGQPQQQRWEQAVGQGQGWSSVAVAAALWPHVAAAARRPWRSPASVAAGEETSSSQRRERSAARRWARDGQRGRCQGRASAQPQTSTNGLCTIQQQSTRATCEILSTRPRCCPQRHQWGCDRRAATESVPAGGAGAAVPLFPLHDCHPDATRWWSAMRARTV